MLLTSSPTMDKLQKSYEPRFVHDKDAGHAMEYLRRYAWLYVLLDATVEPVALAFQQISASSRDVRYVRSFTREQLGKRFGSDIVRDLSFDDPELMRLVIVDGCGDIIAHDTVQRALSPAS